MLYCKCSQCGSSHWTPKATGRLFEMQSQDLIFYLPTAIMSIIAILFAVLWKLGIASSWKWAAGFAQTSLGFALSTYPIEPTFDEFVSGFLYTGAAYCYGSAILIHFWQPMWQKTRLAMVAAFAVAHVYFVLIDPSLRWDLFLIEMVFASLLGLPIWLVLPKAKNASDMALALTALLVVIDCLGRGFFFTFVEATSDSMSDFLHSAYNLEVHVSTITVCLLFPLSAVTAMAKAVVDQHRSAALEDPLTGLLNRRGFETAIAKTVAGSGASGAIITCDIDHFKQINDRYGHAAGDRVIASVARVLAGTGTGTGGSHIGRFGGEEFMICLPGLAAPQAAAIAELLRSRLEGSVLLDETPSHRVTASFGVAEFNGGLEAVRDAIERADAALYRAKGQGRNRVAISLDTDPVADRLPHGARASA